MEGRAIDHDEQRAGRVLLLTTEYLLDGLTWRCPLAIHGLLTDVTLLYIVPRGPGSCCRYSVDGRD